MSGARKALVAVAVLAVTAGLTPAAAAKVRSLEWTDCGDGFQCATAKVPLDYTSPQGASTALSVIRLPATDPARRIGSLFVNPGGPGGSAVDLVRSAGDTFSTELLARFDIVGFDPRGVGLSRATKCFSHEEQQQAYAGAKARPTAADFDSAVRTAARFDQACLRGTGDFLRHLSTENLVRDMDLLRSAVGDDKLTYYGQSYGTYIGTLYANLFPKRVRALALDGAVEPDSYTNQPQEFDRRQTIALDQALGRFLDWCQATPTRCSFGAGNPKVAYQRLVDQLEREPLKVPVGDTVRLVRGYDVLVDSVLRLFNRAAGWPALAAALAAAEQGDGSRLGRIITQPFYTDLMAANVAVECADRHYPSLDKVHAGIRATVAEAPTLGPVLGYGPPGVMEIANGPACAQWPVTANARYRGPFNAKGSAPILVVGTTGDPATPYGDAVLLTKSLDKARLLTMRGEGHTAYGKSPCINDHVDRYLVDGQLPPERTFCDQVIG